MSTGSSNVLHKIGELTGKCFNQMALVSNWRTGGRRTSGHGSGEKMTIIRELSERAGEEREAR